MSTPPLPQAPNPGAPFPHGSSAGTAPAAYAPAPAPATTLGQTNTFAVISVILAFLAPIAGIVFGHLALNQIKRGGDAGRGLALTGLIVGYAWFAVIVSIILLYVFVFFAMFASFAALIDPLYM